MNKISKLISNALRSGFTVPFLAFVAGLLASVLVTPTLEDMISKNGSLIVIILIIFYFESSIH